MPFAETGPVKLYYESHGRRPAVLLVMGSMESPCEKRGSAGHPQKIPVGSRSISSSGLAISVVGAVYL
jgi:hypothetical protein